MFRRNRNARRRMHAGALDGRPCLNELTNRSNGHGTLQQSGTGCVSDIRQASRTGSPAPGLLSFADSDDERALRPEDARRNASETGFFNPGTAARRWPLVRPLCERQ